MNYKDLVFIYRFVVPNANDNLYNSTQYYKFKISLLLSYKS